MITILQPSELNGAPGLPAEEHPLRLTLLGQMQAEFAGHSVLPRSRKTRAVLAVLALAAPMPVLRSKLTGLLWSQRAKEQGRASLRQSVHELQRALGESASTMLQPDRYSLAMSDRRLWLDVRVLATATVTDPKVLDMFRITLLDDLDGLDPEFDRWLADQRQRVTHQALSVAEAVLAREKDPKGRIAAAERLLTIDHRHEPAWQVLISAHLEQGNSAAARFAFERCCAALSHAGVAPSPETEALIRGAPRTQVPTPAGRKLNGRRGVRLCVLPSRPLGGDDRDLPLPGLTEELTAAVSRFRWVSCVAEAVRPKQIELPLHDPDVDYLLDTTLQRAGKRTRVIIRLFDLHAGGNVVWARRFDRDLGDALMLQSEIASETAAQIDLELLLREGDRRNSSEPGEATAFDHILRAVPAIYRLEPSAFHEAGELLSTAVSMEPGNAAANAWWAYWHLFLVGQAWASDPVASALRAGELAERAVTLDPGDARALALVGHVRSFLHKRAAEASTLLERALVLNPNLPLAWCFSGLAQCYLGRHAMAIEQIKRATHLSPDDPHAFFFDTALMMPHFLRGEFDKALALGRRSIELNPRFTATYKGYLATLGHLYDDQEASRILGRLLALEPGFSIRSALERSPIKRQVDLELYAQGLRRAGLPET